MSRRLHRTHYLVMGTLSLFFCGLSYSWSILKAPLAEAFGWTDGQLAVTYTCLITGIPIGGLLAAFLARRMSVRLRMILFAALTFLAFFSVSLLDGSALLPLYLGYGLLFGISSGAVYNLVISVTGAWFPDRTGLCAGVQFMGYGVSTLILGKAASWMIESEAIGFRWTYRILGMAVAACFLVGAFVFREAPADLTARLAGTRPLQEADAELTVRQLVKKGAFWRLFLAFLCFLGACNIMVSFARDFMLSFGTSEETAVTLVGIFSLCNGLVRILCGLIYDRFGRRASQYVLSAVSVCTGAAAALAAASGSLPVGICALLFNGLALGYAATSIAAYARSFFGHEHFAFNFSFLYLLNIPASVAASVAGAMVTSTGGYLSSCVLMLAMMTVGAAACLSVKKVRV